MAERDRNAPVGEQAFDVVNAIGAPVDLDQATEGAAPDPLRGEPVCLRVGFDDGLASVVAWYRENRPWWEPLKRARSS